VRTRSVLAMVLMRTLWLLVRCAGSESLHEQVSRRHRKRFLSGEEGGA
jgi:hypothetical protein